MEEIYYPSDVNEKEMEYPMEQFITDIEYAISMNIINQ